MNKIIVIIIALLLFVHGSAIALKKPMIFPKNGQSRELRIQDESYCKSWAEEETDVDPSYIRAKLESVNEQLMSSSASEQPRMGRRLLRGAALGAAMGGIDSGIDNNVGKRAVQAAVLSGSRARQEKKQAYQEKQYQSQANKQQQLLSQYDDYIRAFSVCMDAKGYSVK